MVHSPGTQYTLLQPPTTDDEPSPSNRHHEITIETLNHKQSINPTHSLLSMMLAAICLIGLSGLMVALAYELNLPVSKLISQSFAPAANNLIVPNITDTVPPPSISSIHSFESYSEEPHGYWTDSGNNGTRFIGFGDEIHRYEPLIDLLIGEQCGGAAGLDYGDFTPIEFLRNQSMLMVGDSTDRYMVQYLCASLECGWRCPKACEYTRDVLGAQFTHFTYSGIEHPYKMLIGVSSCHIPLLNFTLSQAMTYSILPERYSHYNFTLYNFTEGHRTIDGPLPYTYRHFIQQFVKPFFDTGALPSPTILTAQSGLWDIQLLTTDRAMSIHDAELDLRTQWWHELNNTMIPALEQAFPDVKLRYLRTIPPVKDYNNNLCAEVSTMMRFYIQSMRKRDPTMSWRLWDTALMLVECEQYEFDDHHYGPHVMNQLFNVLLNDIKARRSLL